MLIILDVLGEKKEIFNSFQFKMEEIEGFRYRAQVSAVSCSRMLALEMITILLSQLVFQRTIIYNRVSAHFLAMQRATSREGPLDPHAP